MSFRNHVTIGHIRYRFCYAFGRHREMMINDKQMIANDDECGISAEIEHTTRAPRGRSSQDNEQVPASYVLFKVFNWNGDVNGDVWEIKRRLTITEAKELSRWLAARVRGNQKPLQTRIWHRIRGHDYD
jgi:hypothetical protein